MKPEAVFFDVDDTLLDFRACAVEAISESFARLGVPEPDGLYEAFFAVNPLLWRRIEKGSLDVPGLKRIRWNVIFAVVGCGLDGEAFETLFEDRLFMTGVPVKGAKELLESLSGKVRLFAASNASDAVRQRERLKAAGMLEYFEKVFVSAELGYSKPGREFFDACFAALPGVDPNKCVFVGDSPAADVAGAKNYGMKTVLFDPEGRYPDCPADRIARTPSDIAAAIPG